MSSIAWKAPAVEESECTEKDDDIKAPEEHNKYIILERKTSRYTKTESSSGVFTNSIK